MLSILRRTSTSLKCLIVCATFGAPSAAYANAFYDENIHQLQLDYRACAFFFVDGVGEADPSVPGQPWFAVSKSNVNYDAMVSVLISAKLSGRHVYVYTDGSTSCGYATATTVGVI